MGTVPDTNPSATGTHQRGRTRQKRSVSTPKRVRLLTVPQPGNFPSQIPTLCRPSRRARHHCPRRTESHSHPPRNYRRLPTRHWKSSQRQSPLSSFSKARLNVSTKRHSRKSVRPHALKRSSAATLWRVVVAIKGFIPSQRPLARPRSVPQAHPRRPRLPLVSSPMDVLWLRPPV